MVRPQRKQVRLLHPLQERQAGRYILVTFRDLQMSPELLLQQVHHHLSISNEYHWVDHALLDVGSHR